ncbi:MAG: hypothetical protein WAL89_06650 [Candidatus Sulfotelmatobacter sp.]|jgi:hypothetical protein
MRNPSLASASRTLALFTLCLCLAITPVQAQQSPSPTNQDEVNKQLLQRLQELENEVKQLKAQAASPTPVPPPAPAPAPEPPSAVEMPQVNEVAPRLKLNVFGDVGAQGYNHIPDTFLFGSLDLFMTARLSDKASVLGEVLFTADNTNTISPDVERLLFKWRQNDYFTASVGRFHSWVGFYNSTFNYGEFLETTTDRPFIFAFDDQGGVLPMQDVGVNLTGKIPSGKMGLNYVLEVSNGEAWGPNVEPAQNNQDANNSKAINGGLFMRPERLSGLQLGFSIRHDNLTIPGPPAVHETIAAVHAVFINNKYEILNEAVLVRHVEPTGPAFTTNGGYTQWSRAFGAWRPYFRYQYFNAPNNDPVYSLYGGTNDYAPAYVNNFVARLNGPSLGVRYDFTAHSALKLQYDRISERDLPTSNGLTSQIAFTF